MFIKNLLSTQNLVLSYSDREIKIPDLNLYQGDRLLVRGDNDSGKSTFLKAIVKKFDGLQTGNLVTTPVKFSYLSQNLIDFSGNLKQFGEQEGLELSLFLNILRKLGFERDNFFTPINSLSQGQRKKAALAKSLCLPTTLYIWDEPLNYLDVYNVKQVEEVIERTQPTMIFVEHDRTFSDKIATKEIKLGE